MKWFRFAGAVVATLGLTTAANASLLDLFGSHGSSKSCGCAPCSQPQCCKPTITKPCCPTVHTYQRKISDKKPPCCDTCCAPKHCCAPVAKCCAPAAVKCAAPAPVKCAAPAAVAGCCAPKTSCCNTGCCPKPKCCNADPCVIAKLIYQSQTACYARDRRKAIEKLGNNFDCQCNPEIMVAFIHALNDSDERVRAEAADELGDQLRKNSCCCSKEITAALTVALGDCDRSVRRQATQGLKACGYEVVKGCCDCVSCDPCKKQCGCSGGVAPTPAGMDKTAPPAPGSEKVFIPAGLRRTNARPSRLANLFGLLN